MSSKKSVNIKDLIMGLGPLLALVLLCIVLSFATDKFLHYSNFMNILKQAAINCLIASGMLVVLITAGIDLSVGSNCVLSACIMGVMMQHGITNTPLLMAAALFSGGLVGYINGLLLTKLNLPHPFVSTLGMKNIVLGIALLITKATPIGFQNKGVDALLYLGSKTIKGFPISFIVVMFLYGLFHIFLNQTALGRNIYCVGGNAEASRLSGIDSKRVMRIVYTLSGLMCGLAGIVQIGRAHV